MGNYEDLKAAIADVIYQNGNNEITGLLLQQTLLSIVNNLGEYATFGGIATPDTNPGTADQNIYYLAAKAGTYVNFGGISIAEGEAVVLSNKTGVWVKHISGFSTQEKTNDIESYKLREADMLKGFWTGSTGVFEASEAFMATTKMPCLEKKINVLRNGQSVNCRVLFWTKDDIFIQSFVLLNSAIDVPENARFFAVNVCINNAEFPQYVQYSVDEVEEMQVIGVPIVNTIVSQANEIIQHDKAITELQQVATANTPTFNELGYEFGFYDSVGQWNDSELFVATEFIGVTKGDKLYINSDYNNLNARIILFGVTKNFIERGLIDENGFVIPDDIYYVRFVFDIGDSTTGLTVVTIEDFKTMYASGFNLFAHIQQNEQEIENIKEQITGVPCLFNVPINFHKDDLRILDIGNSYTQDCHTYIADILNSYGYNEGYSLYSAIRGSGSFKSWVDQYNNTDYREYSINHVAGESLGIEGVGVPYNGELFRNALNENWDIILIHTYSGYSTDFEQWQGNTDGGYLNELIQILKQTNPQATIGFLLVHSYKSDYEGNTERSSFERWKHIVLAAKQLKVSYGIDFIIPYGTALQNLRNVILNDNEFTEDGTHLAKGLADYTASCCYYQSLFAPRFGQSIIGNTFRVNGLSGVGEVDVTNDNAIVAQKAALFATCNMWNITNIIL